MVTPAWSHATYCIKLHFLLRCTIAFTFHQAHSKTKRVVPPPPAAFRVGGFFNPVPALEQFEKF